jgi:hypothetical protein
LHKHGRTDATQKDVVKALRAIGCSVAVTSSLGKGFPDIVCALRGRTVLMEIKDGSKPPSARKLTPDEERFRQAWRGEYVVVLSAQDAIDVMLGAAAA